MLGSHNLMTFILTSKPEKAKTFYADTLGLTFVTEDQYAVVFDANGITVRLSIMSEHKPLGSTVLGWSVPDIVETAKGLMQAGVKFERYAFMEQDELGIWTSPDSKAKVAWFKDPDGNVLSISQAGCA